MNWEIAGALGEIISGVAVIASLVYLSIQIRNTSRQVRTEAIYNMQVEQNSISETISSDPEVLEVLLKARDGELTEIERLKVIFFLARLVGVFLAIENAMKNDSLDEDFYNDTKLQFENFIKTFKIYDLARSYVLSNHPHARRDGMLEILFVEEVV